MSITADADRAAAGCWYLVYSKSRQERVAKLNLERQGYETYLPLIHFPRRRLGKRYTAIEPMFPRYLFIHLNIHSDNWSPIHSTVGVIKLIRFGQEPAKVPDELVDMIRERDDVDGIQELPTYEYKQGDRVQIVDGPMQGYEGIYLARSGNDRVIVLLELMGRHARVRVNDAHIEVNK